MPIVGSFAGASARAYGLGAGGVGIGDFESIATITVTGSTQATIEFTSIPSTYTHLQIRGISRDNRTGVSTNPIYAQFNSDTAANYSYHFLGGNGSSGSSSYAPSQTQFVFHQSTSADASASVFSVAIMDILDYANTNKFKTIRSLSGYDNNGSGLAYLWSGNWRSTNAITSIKFTPATSGSFVQYSSFALYGVK